MSPSTLIHDFPSGLLSQSQTEAFEHLTRAYRYLCQRFVYCTAPQDAIANLDARNHLLWLRDAVLADYVARYDGRMMEGLTGLVERAEKQ